MSTDPFIDCILFDLDGVLVNASDWHYEALNRALRSVCETEISIDEHLGEFNGLSTKQKLELLVTRKRVHHSSVGDVQAEKQLRTIEVIEKMCKPTDRVEILGKLTKFKMGCVTNCITKTAQMMIDKSWLKDYVKVLVTNETSTRPKPFPDPYIVAMYMLRAKPWTTLVIEDNKIGIKSAKRAGVKYIHVLKRFDKLKDIIKKYKLLEKREEKLP